MATSRVCLNIGGRLYETTKMTLCKESESYFSRMFDHDWSEQILDKPESEIFIDRDPNNFAIILDFLRYGYCVLPDNDHLWKLEMDVDYYNLQEMSRYIKDQTTKKFPETLIHFKSTHSGSFRNTIASEGMDCIRYGNIVKHCKLTCQSSCNLVGNIEALVDNGMGTKENPIQYYFTTGEFKHLMKYLRTGAFNGCNSTCRKIREVPLKGLEHPESEFFCPRFQRYLAQATKLDEIEGQPCDNM